MNKKNYWCFRIDTKKIDFISNELNAGRLRQGWGWDEKQDLRSFEMDGGAERNIPMFNKVKEGDILLIPQLPNWGEVTLAEATEDWHKGYDFKIDEELKDYGHIFPAKRLKKFTRNNENVTGSLRSTLKNPSRFWNVNRYSYDIDILLSSIETELITRQSHENRLETSIESIFAEIFDETLFADKLFQKLTTQFTAGEWERALVYGLKQIFPYYQIESVGGKKEKDHGTDILIKLPSILPNYGYAIAIQVKDHVRLIKEEVINQINKSEKYWDGKNLKLVDKIVIIIRANREDNIKLTEYDKSIKFIFAEDLKGILMEIGKSFMGIKQEKPLLE